MQMIMRAATMEWRFLERNVVHFSDDDDAVNSERRTKKKFKLQILPHSDGVGVHRVH